MLVGHDWLKLLRLLNHFLDFRDSGNSIAEIFLLVYLYHLCLKICSDSMAELFYGVDASSFEKFCELTCYAIDAEEIGVVDPCENQLL